MDEQKAQAANNYINSQFTWKQLCQFIYQFHALMSALCLKSATFHQQPWHCIFQQNPFKLCWLPASVAFLPEQHISHNF